MYPLSFPTVETIKPPWDIIHQVQRFGAGRRTLIFPTLLVNLVVVCGLNFRERFFSLRGLIAKISESYPANKPVAIQEGGREIPSRVAREHRADTIPNEMRHVDQSESRSCAVVERDDGRKKKS